MGESDDDSAEEDEEGEDAEEEEEDDEVDEERELMTARYQRQVSEPGQIAGGISHLNSPVLLFNQDVHISRKHQHSGRGSHAHGSS